MKNERTHGPDYKRIFTDIIKIKYPHKEEECKSLLNKSELLSLDIITLNQKIFGVEGKETDEFNQSHRSYSKQSILEILEYQKKNRLNNSQLALHFKISRNTIKKWNKLAECNLIK
jgi:DNA-binding transcriptional regulator YiaG